MTKIYTHETLTTIIYSELNPNTFKSTPEITGILVLPTYTTLQLQVFNRVKETIQRTPRPW